MYPAIPLAKSGGQIVGKRLLVIGAVLLAGWMLGLLHGVLSAIIPVIILKFALLGGLAFAMAALLKHSAEHTLGDPRPKALPLLGAALGVFALWGSWCGWVWAASGFDYFLALHPIDLYDLVRGVTDRVEYTASSHGMKTEVSRASVRAAWLLEAITIGISPVLAGIFAAWGEEKKDWGI
jgi:hypothetical protein